MQLVSTFIEQVCTQGQSDTPAEMPESQGVGLQHTGSDDVQQADRTQDHFRKSGAGSTSQEDLDLQQIALKSIPDNGQLEGPPQKHPTRNRDTNNAENQPIIGEEGHGSHAHGTQNGKHRSSPQVRPDFQHEADEVLVREDQGNAGGGTDHADLPDVEAVSDVETTMAEQRIQTCPQRISKPTGRNTTFLGEPSEGEIEINLAQQEAKPTFNKPDRKFEEALHKVEPSKHAHKKIKHKTKQKPQRKGCSKLADEGVNSDKENSDPCDNAIQKVNVKSKGKKKIQGHHIQKPEKILKDANNKASPEKKTGRSKRPRRAGKGKDEDRKAGQGKVKEGKCKGYEKGPEIFWNCNFNQGKARKDITPDWLLDRPPNEKVNFTESSSAQDF